MTIDPATLRELGIIAVEMTRLRQNECKHLVIENCGPEIFGKVVDAYLCAGKYVVGPDGHAFKFVGREGGSGNG